MFFLRGLFIVNNGPECYPLPLTMNQENSWQQRAEMVRRTATRKGRERGGYFSIEGIRLHERALRAGVKIEWVIATDGFLQDSGTRIQNLLADLEEQGSRITMVPDQVITGIVGDRDLGQVLGLIRMPEQRQLADILKEKERPLILAAVDVKDPGNVGAMLRTAHASGAAAFAASGISDPYHPKALRTGMGSIFRVPVFYCDQALLLIKQLRGLGIETVGTAVDGDVSLPAAQFSDAGVAVLMGSEAWGLARKVTDAVDQLVSIPMGEDVDSFSVNAAAAVVLYEIGRKWSEKPVAHA